MLRGTPTRTSVGPFARLAKKDRDALADEAERLAAFVGEDTPSAGVRFERA